MKVQLFNFSLIIKPFVFLLFKSKLWVSIRLFCCNMMPTVTQELIMIIKLVYKHVKVIFKFFYTLGMIQMYESELKRVNSTTASIRYDLTDLFRYIDKFYDVSCLKYI